MINTLTWKYSLAAGGANSGTWMGISKTLKVNNEDLLSVFYDKLQRRQVLYSLTSNGKECIKIRCWYEPAMSKYEHV